jgi:cell division protease FtsH
MEWLRTAAVWIALVLVVVAVAALLGEDPPRGTADDLRADLRDQQVLELGIDGGDYRVERFDGEAYLVDPRTLTPADFEAIASQAIPIDVEPGWGLAPLIAGLVGAVAVLYLLLRLFRAQQGRAGKQWTDMAKSRARLVERPPDTRLSDVGGCDAAKERLGDLVDFLRNPAVWQASGARIPRGILLEGPPGTGKTHLARAVAGEAGVRFFVASGSEFVEMLIGVGAARVRDLFESAGKVAPAVIFIDELDAIGRRRGSGTATWNEERELTLNQLLASMDGFQPTDRIVVIGATNRADILDPALVRPGRFDVLLSLPPLDVPGRRQVLGIHARGKSLGEVDLDRWAERTGGATGALLEQLMNEAALEAVRRRKARGVVAVRDEDLATAWDAVRAQPAGLTGLDRALAGSAWQLVRPEAPLTLRIALAEGRVVVGELLWADGVYVKLRAADGQEVAVAKSQIATIEPEPAAQRLSEAG